MFFRKSFTSNILYVGYGNRDPNWALVQSEISAEFGSSPLPPSYRIAPNTDPLEVELLAFKGITTIDANYKELRTRFESLQKDGRSYIPYLGMINTDLTFNTQGQQGDRKGPRNQCWRQAIW